MPKQSEPCVSLLTWREQLSELRLFALLFVFAGEDLSHVFKKRGVEDWFYQKSYISPWRGIKGSDRRTMLKMELFGKRGGRLRGCVWRKRGWKEEVCRDKEKLARCTPSLSQCRSWPQFHAKSSNEKPWVRSSHRTQDGEVLETFRRAFGGIRVHGKQVNSEDSLMMRTC